jgi:hypothetical protein
MSNLIKLLGHINRSHKVVGWCGDQDVIVKSVWFEHMERFEESQLLIMGSLVRAQEREQNNLKHYRNTR